MTNRHRFEKRSQVQATQREEASREMQLPHELRQLEWDKTAGNTAFVDSNRVVDRHNREILIAYNLGRVSAAPVEQFDKLRAYVRELEAALEYIERYIPNGIAIVASARAAAPSLPTEPTKDKEQV